MIDFMIPVLFISGVVSLAIIGRHLAGALREGREKQLEVMRAQNKLLLSQNHHFGNIWLQLEERNRLVKSTNAHLGAIVQNLQRINWLHPDKEE